ncbi:AMP-dependent synthetase/ligase [Phytohabitans flavus]|uniref:Acyl-CoA synthetase n=1 Tax=Phytohabitans flavus TaxID=1076124 RepID=A0A6F8XP83_9ACTN|nr:AMP-binding protein [Phytohabitans flavus]BCB75633.1 AMP-binding protein [Phytohabitans flavus]
MTLSEAAEIGQVVAGRTLLHAFHDNARDHPDLPALKWRDGTQWSSFTWREYRAEVEAATLGLVEVGVRPGDRVGVLMSNRPELAVADLALLHARAVPVCLFDSFTGAQLSTVLRTLGIGLVIVEDGAAAARLAAATPAGALRFIVVEGGGWERVMAAGREVAARDGDAFDRSWRAARPDDVVSVNYTSGTTGALKGVQHTHGNVLWHAESFGRFWPVAPGTRFLAYLPRAHATERFVTTWYPLVRAGTVHLCPDPGRLPEYLPDVRPQFFGGVLRVWEKLYAARALAGLEECAFAFSGGGALAEPVQEYFNAAGVPLAEGWGQSELVSAATCGHPDRIRIGTSGRALPGVEVRTAGDGELLVRSGSRMLGYVDTPSHVDEGGWAHTGDLGEIDPDGYVRVHGRREEVFPLAGGHRVPATRVESHLRANLLVDQACVVGEGEPDLHALLVVAAPPDRWTVDDLAAMVAAANERLPVGDRIARFAVLTERWEPGRAEELTHTGKLKRQLIEAKHADLVAALRRGDAGVAVP